MIGLVIMIYDGQAKINLYGLAVSFFGLFLFCLVHYPIKCVGNNHKNSPSLVLFINIFELTTLSLLLLFFPHSTSITMPVFGKRHDGNIQQWIFFYILSWVLFFEGARHIGAIRASMMACVEPLCSSACDVLFVSNTLCN